eukprot:sb/3464032/
MPICSVSSRQCFEDGKEFAEQALVFDQAGDTAAAIFYYTEAANVLLNAIAVDARAEQLKKVISMSPKIQEGTASADDSAILQNVEFIMEQAILEDEAGHFATALERYKDTAQLCLRARSNVTLQSTLHKLNLRADQSLRRAEELTSQLRKAAEDKSTNSTDTGYAGSGSESESGPPTLSSRAEEVPRPRGDTPPSSSNGTAPDQSVIRKLKPEEVSVGYHGYHAYLKGSDSGNHGIREQRVITTGVTPSTCLHHGRCYQPYKDDPETKLAGPITSVTIPMVMGGYDFPGSSSNVDLTALTGWVPERCNTKRGDVNTDSLYKRMLDGHRTGDVLMTVATGDLSKAECDRTGLVGCHAYAVLDLREVGGLRMIQLKNPWCHLRWKGKFSPLDKESWTPELQKALNFDLMSAIEYDNGVFWISWEICMHFFDVVYLNWNPKLFLYKYNLHADWAADQGPKKDHYNLEYNPQYKLEIQGSRNSGKPCTMWILLSRSLVSVGALPLSC